MENKTDIARTAKNTIEASKNYYEVTPAVDTYESKDEIMLRIDMPGIEKKDLTINIDNGVLSISGLRKLVIMGTSLMEEFGDVEYKRSFSIPQTINVERVEAELKDGVLNLHLPKSEAAKPRLIEIKTA
ncbi:MAG: Hsp20/alpha crystallin family protein [Desulfobacula sp.]|uniref:Hsp20/alpha crystallin family protein n=1 Tax=Desulfobacula sp. TaxID=2593537 RepID=UPI001D74D621|nr:Hsp20/alpha crystallin family protein [Desulfobacula sp.]MBT3484455.1 Hsp20/alpha crystallin family protein [Desulfobacula sp.]MBT3803093.1 Hsp20/alpha crystallin family protein [Desulfobacula sp.]MBT4024663.1 Hsp20/alpha crystallin family protein [Desulfobacula sp.]MBT4197141.1 Hsp20/alpha crystallin family protein [Desulfobacula sp.]